jgi:hypothetical protein
MFTTRPHRNQNNKKKQTFIIESRVENLSEIITNKRLIYGIKNHKTYNNVHMIAN